MGDILLDNPLQITNPATRVNNYSWSITPSNITVHLNYFAVDGTTIVKQEIFYIAGSDFDALKNAVITSGAVGQKYVDVIERAIRNKVLSIKGWVGTLS